MKNPVKIKLVVSDFHLGKGRYFRDGTQNILEDFVYDREFVEFLDFYRHGEFKDADVELILNGDILNLLQIDTYGVHTHMMTEKSVVRALKRIIEGHHEFFVGLKKFAAAPHHKITYIIGNHDVGMLWPEAQKFFSQAIDFETQFIQFSYQFDGVYVEHGQQYEKFAATDPNRPFITRGLPEPVLNLPWGSLLVAVLLPKLKQQRPAVDKVRPFQTFVTWSFVHDFTWAVRAAFHFFKFVMDTMLFKRRYQVLQGVRTTLALLKEVSLYPNYDKIAFKVLEENENVHTVIFGHTHILKHRLWKEGKEYFNEGTWNSVTVLDLDDYGTRTKLTYAFIEFPQAEGETPIKPKVKIKEWKGIWKPEVDAII